MADYITGRQTFIPFHEFLASIILEDRKLFRERDGDRFMNVFTPAAEPNASHFTVLRILAYFESVGQEGKCDEADFVQDAAIFEQFEPQGYKQRAIRAQMERMARFGLLATRNGRTVNLAADENFAVTKCGLYYLKTLYKNFTYFSTMASDVPIRDEPAAQSIAGLLKAKAHLPTIPILDRLEIAERLLEYLDGAERRELATGVISANKSFGDRHFVPAMIEACEKVRTSVQRRTFS